MNIIHNNRTMTSREIAELTGKRHDHLLRDIRIMEEAWVKIGQHKFGETFYTDQWNRKQPQYELSKTETLYIATKLNDEARARLIIRWEQLENEKRIPQSFSEALLLAASQAAEIEEKNKVIAAQLPKAIFADAVEASNTSILVGELAKILKQNGVEIGQNRLFEWMRQHNFMISRRGTDYNMPTQKSMDLNLFEIKETTIVHSDGHISINKTAKVTGKGQTYFINKFLAKPVMQLA